MKPVYLDYHATTPVDPRVLADMLPYFSERFGNAASRQHAWGWEAKDAVDEARGRVAALINASAAEITFTSGASESNNLALKGAVAAARSGLAGEARATSANHVVTSAVEHKSVLDVCKGFAAEGCEVTVVGVRPDGLIDLEALERAVRPGTILVSVMAANNEIGTVQPLAAMAAIAHAHGALFHTDAAQAAGKVPIDVVGGDIDLLSLTAHKFYGPKGSGALFIRKRRPRISIPAQIAGGGQEGGLRSGTLNVPGIVGLGRAAEICRLEMADEARRLGGLRDRLLDGLREALGAGVHVNGTMTPRLPHNLHVSFDGVEGEALLMALGDLAVSTGSACASGSQALSHVLQAIGATSDRAGASIRFGLGRTTTDADIDFAIERVSTVVAALRRQTASA
ncbi:MAG TPA: aminotransferase class V-fold PLP-dependent enzyme [Vicinamibacterales bacterium]|nr:aminotransferase class V-fold PLP-dependent enzyme [Vicinamibacterales bacterium]